MITFENGPAVGHTLKLSRAPRFLRVCRSPQLTFSALEKPDDRAAIADTLIAYEIASSRTPRGTVDANPVASYRMVQDQPDDAVMRDAEKWKAWATERAAKKT